MCLQVDARHKGSKKHRHTKSSKHDSSSEPHQQGSPGKAHKHSTQHAGQQHSNAELAPNGEEPQQQGRSSTASNQIVLSDPAAAFVLVATQEFVRVYSITHAVSADRTTLRKVATQGNLQFASAFMACGSPALACLLELDGEIHLQVRPGGHSSPSQSLSLAKFSAHAASDLPGATGGHCPADPRWLSHGQGSQQCADRMIPDQKGRTQPASLSAQGLNACQVLAHHRCVQSGFAFITQHTVLRLPLGCG